MEGFGDQDAAGGGEVGFGGDVHGRTEIGRDADAFDDGGEGDEFLGGGHGERVCAGGDGGGSCGGQTGFEVENVSLFIVGDVLELIVESGGEARVGEILLAPLAKSFLVESIFEMFQLGGVSV